MTEALCSYCKLFGKPSARVNFIISITAPGSLVHKRIQYILENNAEASSLENDGRLAKYETLMDIGDQIFNRQNDSSSVNQVTSTLSRSCCHGFTLMPLNIDNKSSSSQLDTFQEDILDLLDPKADEATEEQDSKPKSSSWIIISGSMCLEPAFFNIFLQINDQKSSLLTFTLNVLCFLVTEQRLFEMWSVRNQPLQDYNKTMYPDFEREINNFFSLLNSSTDLQKNTLLINEQDYLTDAKLQTLLQSIFYDRSLKFRANNDKLRNDMAKLLVCCPRKVYDVSNVRTGLQRCYNPMVDNRLKPLLNDLQQTTTAANAARKIIQIVLDEFEFMNDEERRVYKRQMMIGFQSGNAEKSNTIVAQLVHYAFRLLKNKNDTLIPLVYSIVLVICKLGSHYIFRHELLNHTPEIYEVSLLLISQRQYALTLAGLRLCITILNGDRNEHKYALAYLKYDTFSARKILDAVKWLLSPFHTLKVMWEKEHEEQDNYNSQ